MKILGISGSPREETTAALVKHVLDATGLETEFISLAGTTISPCTACGGCVADNTCTIEDDMTAMRQQIVDADAYVIGGANYYGMPNALLHCFLERWYQFRHRGGMHVAGKLAVVVGVGGMTGEPVVERLDNFLSTCLIDTVAKVSARGVSSCQTCENGETCMSNPARMQHGPGGKITDAILPCLADQPDVLEHGTYAGKLLAERLTTGHRRSRVMRDLMAKFGDRFKAVTGS